MIVQFTIGNYLSFKENKTLYLTASNATKEHEKDGNSLYENVFLSPQNDRLLKSTIFYGENGSGKSNLLIAMEFFRDFILESYQKSIDADINVSSFKLNAENEKMPSFFEMVFFVENTRYRYGFEADKTQIHSEWLFELTSSREKTLFIRDFQEFSKVFKEGKKSVKSTRKDALFLSTIAQDNGEIALKIRDFFKELMILVGGNFDHLINSNIKKMQQNPAIMQKVVDFFKTLQMGVQDIRIERTKNIEIHQAQIFYSEQLDKMILHYPTQLIEDFKKTLNALKESEKDNPNRNFSVENEEIQINFYHPKYDKNGNFLENVVIDFGLQSEGTQKLFALLGFWFDAIEHGKIIIIDELDSSLHTLLTQELIKFFHLKTNKNAQLIVAVHDTNLLKKEIFRRDQVWFAEKNRKTNQTDLYSMVEYKEHFVRNDTSFEKGYLEGKYGAIPYLGNINQFVQDFLS